MTTAKRISQMFDGDGQLWELPDGTSLDQVCRKNNANISYRNRKGHQKMIRYSFCDGSAIVDAGDGWDVEGHEPFSWAGTE